MSAVYRWLAHASVWRVLTKGVKLTPTVHTSPFERNAPEVHWRWIAYGERGRRDVANGRLSAGRLGLVATWPLSRYKAGRTLLRAPARTFSARLRDCKLRAICQDWKRGRLRESGRLRDWARPLIDIALRFHMDQMTI